jgi:predicted permease
MRLALRRVTQRPALSLAIVATLAIGIGANTAIYSVFNWILLRPMPGVSRPDELVTIRFLRPGVEGRFFVSYHDVADLRDGLPGLSGLTASAPLAMNVLTDAATPDAERLDGELVSANYFDVLGVRPNPGRGFTSSEEMPGSQTPSAVISAALWRRAYAANPAVLGRTISINGRALTIVGVAPAGFFGRSPVTASDVWVPIAAHSVVAPTYGADFQTNRRRTLFGDAIGRLRPGITIAAVQEQANAVAARTPDFVNRRPGSPRNVQPTVFAGIGHDTYAHERLTRMFRVVMTCVTLILLLACANAANLLLARAASRRRDMAIARAIGATGFRLARQQLVEGLVLSAAAGVAALGLAVLLVSLFDGVRIVSWLPVVRGVALDVRVLAFTAAVALLSGLLFAMAPAFAASRVDLRDSLRDGQTSSRRGRPVLRTTLVVMQVAVSVTLLAGCGLFVRTLRNIQALDLGMRPGGLVAFSADPTKLGYSTERAQHYFETTVERLRATPGLNAVAFAWTTPFGYIGTGGTGLARADGKPFEGDASVDTNMVADGYFAVMGIPVLAGREFTRADLNDAAGVVILSRLLANRVFPDGGGLGSDLVLDSPKGKIVRIVGIVGDVRGRPLTDPPVPLMYRPGRATFGTVIVRSSLREGEAIASIRAVTRAVEPALPPYDLEPMNATVARTLAEQMLLARLSLVFAIVAAFLASIGIYAMLATAVAERRREFGIRIALGARANEILSMVAGSAMRPCVLGVVAGTLGALAFGRIVESRLFGVTARDPLTLAAAVLLLLCVGLVASAIPAIRASRVDPVRSLRAE